MMSRSQVCLVLPECSATAASHFAHLPRLVRELSEHVQVAVVAQRGARDATVPGSTTTVVQRAGGPARRALELAGILWRLRGLGYRTVFVRISISGVVVASVLARLAGMRVMYWHSGQQWPSALTGAGARLTRWRQTIAQSVAFRLCHRLVTGPSTMAAYYATQFGVPREKILLASNDIDVTASDAAVHQWTVAEARGLLDIPPTRPVVVFIGRVSGLKGGQYLVPLAARLKAAEPEVLVVVAGDVHRAGFKDEIDRAGVAHNVRVLGPIANPDVALLHRAADVFVLPSNAEGFPRALLEAMAFGTPSVAFAAGGVREILGADCTEWVTEIGDVAGMADRVLRLLRSRDERARLSTAVRVRVLAFDTPRVARELAALFTREAAP